MTAPAEVTHPRSEQARCGSRVLRDLRRVLAGRVARPWSAGTIAAALRKPEIGSADEGSAGRVGEQVAGGRRKAERDIGVVCGTAVGASKRAICAPAGQQMPLLEEGIFGDRELRAWRMI